MQQSRSQVRECKIGEIQRAHIESEPFGIVLSIVVPRNLPEYGLLGLNLEVAKPAFKHFVNLRAFLKQGLRFFCASGLGPDFFKLFFDFEKPGKEDLNVYKAIHVCFWNTLPWHCTPIMFSKEGSFTARHGIKNLVNISI
jgi:hypothetical protein